MKYDTAHQRTFALRRETLSDLSRQLSNRLIGQPAAVEAIVPYVEMYEAGLSPEGRPAGVFLLLGPTGTGKTKTVEALAEILHGSEGCLLKIDCGEFQMEHEVAKLIGAPPGYLGHRETQPVLSQQRLNMATSDRCGLALVLFDEIEKAAPSLGRLLLGVLDKGVLRLGDNSTVNFEHSLVFLTSNLGSSEMMNELCPNFGFQAAFRTARNGLHGKIGSIAIAAVRKKFSPEFINRIDRIITYRPLDESSLAGILDQHIEELKRHVTRRLGPRSFEIDVPYESRRFLLQLGTSPAFGARELKRTVLRHLTQPIASLVAGGRIAPGASVRVELDSDKQGLCIRY
jgi:ATP-dependent Clp protease ATP-binding subunit ClpA